MKQNNILHCLECDTIYLLHGPGRESVLLIHGIASITFCKRKYLRREAAVPMEKKKSLESLSQAIIVVFSVLMANIYWVLVILQVL